MTVSSVSMARARSPVRICWVAERDAEQWLFGLEGEALFELVGGEFELVLVLEDAGAIVVDQRGRSTD